MSELVIRQTVTSGSSKTTFELLRNGALVAGRMLDSSAEDDAALLKSANEACLLAHRDSLLERDRTLWTRGPKFDLARLRDRSAETQAMVRAFAGVVFPEQVK